MVLVADDPPRTAHRRPHGLSAPHPAPATARPQRDPKRSPHHPADVGHHGSVRDFSVLSDVEFEELLADLLAAAEGVAVERFAAGRDSGIDLRWTRPEGTTIAQCKHYQRSTFSMLLTSARKELSKVAAVAPSSYLFITSFDLGVGQKEKIYQIFKSWMKGPQDVLGGRDIDGLLTSNPEVERRHPKLWVSTGMQLFWANHSDIASRSIALKQRIDKAIPRYVVSNGYKEAQDILSESNICIISGAPGIGKTALAWMLMAEYISAGYEPIEVSIDINEAWTALEANRRQIFLYDDFLGQISFTERLAKNEDSRISSLVEAISTSPDKRLILTTREYILRDARRLYERLDGLDRRHNFILSLKAYTRTNRAHILYNHLWNSSLPIERLREVSQGGFKAIIDHESYNPRLVEYCTGNSFNTEEPDYPGRVVEFFNNPDLVWRTAFDKHLTNSQRLLLLTLASIPHAGAEIRFLQAAHRGLCMQMGVPLAATEFHQSLEVLEGTFVSLNGHPQPVAEFANPSIRQFTIAYIYKDETVLQAIFESAEYFEQISSITPWATSDLAEPDSLKVLSRLGQSISNAILKTFSAPQVITSSRYNAPQYYDSREERVDFCLRNSNWLPVPREFLQRIVDETIANWRAHEGDKSAAGGTLLAIGDSFPDDCHEEAHAALDGWLENTLLSTSDWEHFTDHLEEFHSDEYWDTSKFEDFIESSVFREGNYSDLEELASIAERLGMHAVSSRLTSELEIQAAESYEGWGAEEGRESESNLSSFFNRSSDDRHLQSLFDRLNSPEN